MEQTRAHKELRMVFMVFKPQHSFKPPTPEDLAKAALSYLSRYSASEASLRRALDNRLRRAALRNGVFASDKAAQARLHAAIEDIIARYKKSGVLNDATFAEMKVNSLRRSGKSARVILQALTLKGVDKATIRCAMVQNEYGVDAVEVERKAALAFAKRRRLGPFRGRQASIEQQRKDLAALARAGFSLDIARDTLETSINDEEF